jgi:hypothetical protein
VKKQTMVPFSGTAWVKKGSDFNQETLGFLLFLYFWHVMRKILPADPFMAFFLL